MNRRYDCAAFDLDGTLLDTSEGIYSSVRYAVRENGLRELTDDELHTFIGPPLQRSFNRYFGLTGAPLEKIIADYRYIYKRSEMFKAKPYDGIFELLSFLKQNKVSVAAATYKPQKSAEAVLSHFGFDKYLDIVSGADEKDKLKKKDIITTAVSAVGSGSASRTVMVGDSDNDALGALEAGVSFIGVTYGFGFSSSADVEKFPYVYTAASPYDILSFFKNTL